jgi:predicted transcriptional regulator
LANQIWFRKHLVGSISKPDWTWTLGPKDKEEPPMARPTTRNLTERELEIMHVFWTHGEQTAAAARDRLAESGRDRTYTTIANLVRILHEKGFLTQTNAERPFRYRPARSFEDVTGRLLGDLIRRVFRGSREQLLLRLVEQRRLTPRERALLQDILEGKEP